MVPDGRRRSRTLDHAVRSVNGPCSAGRRRPPSIWFVHAPPPVTFDARYRSRVSISPLGRCVVRAAGGEHRHKEKGSHACCCVAPRTGGGDPTARRRGRVVADEGRRWIPAGRRARRVGGGRRPGPWHSRTGAGWTSGVTFERPHGGRYRPQSSGILIQPWRMA